MFMSVTGGGSSVNNVGGAFTPTFWEPEAALAVGGLFVVILVLAVAVCLMFRGME